MPDSFALIVPFAPLAAALLTSFPTQQIGGSKNYRFGLWAHVVAFGFAIALLLQLASSEGTQIRLGWESNWTFLPFIGVTVDRLASIMMVIISGFGVLLYRYSLRYLQQDQGQGRYMTLLTLTVSSLLFMVMCSDLVMLFVFWQFLSWALSLLVHNYVHVPTAHSSFRTFIMHRAGDVAFLGGIVLAYQLYGTVEFSELFKRAEADPGVVSLLGTGLTLSGATAVTLLIFVGAMSKSAQFPLHMWLPDSLFAPTPIHALLHAGIINAGGFLLTRLAPLYTLSTPTLHVVFAVGLITAILGSSMMLVQNDIKKSLGYSTIGQMGYMIMECGLGAYSLAVFHLAAHGLFKATVFLNCGNVIHEARQHPAHPGQHLKASPASPQIWVAGIFTSLVFPLAIVVGAHHILHIPIQESQGLLIFLFFTWVTASQALLTLYRVRGSTKAHSVLLLTVVLVSVAYLFAAEQFTHFLYPDPDRVKEFYEAGKIPSGLFITVVAGFALIIVVGWTASFARRRGQSLSFPKPIQSLREPLYLFFVNRLYLDGVSLRVIGTLRGLAERLDRSRLFMPVMIIIGLGIAGLITNPLEGVSFKSVIGLVVAGLLLPLFPLHGLFISIATKAPRPFGTLLIVATPILGIVAFCSLQNQFSEELLKAVSIISLSGALYATIKAIVQNKVSQRIAYGTLALYSILWWHMGSAGQLTNSATLFAASLILASFGLLFGWDRIRLRYGDLNLNQLGGLFLQMPRLALCMALLVMAIAGLPPFSLFFGYMDMLLDPQISGPGVIVALFTWFSASWIFFKLMQRLLFGPKTSSLDDDDLNGNEITVFIVVILALLALSGISHDWLQDQVTASITNIWK